MSGQAQIVRDLLFRVSCMKGWDRIGSIFGCCEGRGYDMKVLRARIEEGRVLKAKGMKGRKGRGLG